MQRAEWGPATGSMPTAASHLHQKMPQKCYFGVVQSWGAQEPQLREEELNNVQADLKALQYGCD